MTPVEASKKKNEKKVWSNLYGDLIYLKPGCENTMFHFNTSVETGFAFTKG